MNLYDLFNALCTTVTAVFMVFWAIFWPVATGYEFQVTATWFSLAACWFSWMVVLKEK